MGNYKSDAVAKAFQCFVGAWGFINGTLKDCNGNLIPDWHGPHPSGISVFSPSGYNAYIVTANDKTECEYRPTDVRLPAQRGDSERDWATVAQHSLAAGGPFCVLNATNCALDDDNYDDDRDYYNNNWRTNHDDYGWEEKYRHGYKKRNDRDDYGDGSYDSNFGDNYGDDNDNRYQQDYGGDHRGKYDDYYRDDSGRDGPSGYFKEKIWTSTLPSFVGQRVVSEFGFYDDCNIWKLRFNPTHDTVQEAWFYRLPDNSQGQEGQEYWDH